MTRFIGLMISSLALALFFQSCSTDLPGNVDQGEYRNGIFVINEGNFGSSNATLDYYFPEDNRVESSIFSSVNQQPIGDVGQSMTIAFDKAYLIANNSGVIYKLNQNSAALEGTIDGLGSPRYYHAISDTKGYVTDLFSGKIAVLDWESNQVSSEIETGTWTEDLTESNDLIWVCATGLDQLLAYNKSTDELVHTVNVGREPVAIEADINGDLWVLCTGGFEEEDPQLFRVNSFDASLMDSVDLGDITDYPTKLCTNGSQLFWLQGDIKSMDINDTGSVATFAGADGRNFYGLTYYGPENEIYVSDAGDFTSTGNVHRYSMDGTEVGNFPAGIIPGSFAH